MIYWGTRETTKGVIAHVWICKVCKAEILTYNKVEPYCFNTKCVKNIDENNN